MGQMMRGMQYQVNARYRNNRAGLVRPRPRPSIPTWIHQIRAGFAIRHTEMGCAETCSLSGLGQVLSGIEQTAQSGVARLFLFLLT
jgi:hypothetical protein